MEIFEIKNENQIDLYPGVKFKGCVGLSDTSADYSVTIDTSQLGQEMVGFGGAMTHSSAYLIFNHDNRDDIMNKLFASVENGGAAISMLRVPLDTFSL